ncbi:MAG: hypothetical protein ABIR70_03535 [Bryobacteraceae bacterium]
MPIRIPFRAGNWRSRIRIKGKPFENNRISFGYRPAIQLVVIGLAVPSESAVNIPALFGSSAPASPNSNNAGSLLFLDLLGLFGGESLQQDVPLEEDSEPQVPESTNVSLSNIFPWNAPPRDIANALIRSMLTPVERPATQEVTTPPVAPLPIDVAWPALQIEDDWDVPLDWVAPEELDEPEYADVDPMPLSAAIDVPAAVPAQTLPIPSPVPGVELGPTLEAALGDVHERAKVATSSSLPIAAAKPNLSTVVMRGPEAVPAKVPLAFGLKLTEKEPQAPPAVAEPAKAVPAARPELQAETGAPPSKLNVDNPPKVAVKGHEVATPVTGNLADGSEESGDASGNPSSKNEQLAAKNPEPKVSPQRESLPKFTLPHNHPPAAIPSTQMVAATSVTSSEVILTKPSLAETPVTNGNPQIIEIQPRAEVRAIPAREIAVRISAPDAAPVDLHVKERGGEVHVAVRTADTELQTSLRQDLGTLVERLDHSGFRAETIVTQAVVPRTRGESSPSLDLSSTFRAAVPTEPHSPSNDNQPDSSKDRDPAAGYQNPDSSGRQQQQRRQNSSRQFKWMQAMEEEA